MKTKFKSIILTIGIRSAIFAATVINCEAQGIVVDDGSSNWRPVAANEPGSGNVWSSLAQSFTAQDPNILFGFRMLDANSSLPDAGVSIIYNLYAGENSYSDLLATRTVSFPTTFSSDSRIGDVGFVDADFSSISLTVGQKYTVEITIPDANMPAEGSESDLGVWTSNANPYPGGRFFFPAGYDNDFFSGQDMLFQAIPVPEPSTIALGSLGATGLFAYRRKIKK